MAHLNDQDLFDLFATTRVHPHLEECAECKERYHAFIAFDAMLGKHLQKEAKPIDLTDKIMQEIESVAAEKKDTFDYLLVGSIWAVGACILYLAVQFFGDVNYQVAKDWFTSVADVLRKHSLVAQGVGMMILLVFADWLIQSRKKRQKS